jgi:hypothetical protein
MYTEGPVRTFLVGTAVEARRRVKIKAGTVTTPPEVEHAGLGEDFIGITEYAGAVGKDVGVRMNTAQGTFEVECTVGAAIARGTVLYGAAAGKMSDTSNGSAQAVALQVGASNQHIEVALLNVKSTTAATVSIADSGNFTLAATVEAALAEIYQHLVTSQGFINVPLTSFRELAAGVGINAAGNGGILATDTSPIYTNIGDGDAARIAWPAGNADQIQAQLNLPPDIDLTKNLVVHMLCSKDANVNNAVHMDGEAYFGESDADCFPAAAAANLLIQAKGEYTATILAADLPATQTDFNMTLVLMPEAHAGDAVYLHGVWLEYTKKILTT